MNVRTPDSVRFKAKSMDSVGNSLGNLTLYSLTLKKWEIIKNM